MIFIPRSSFSRQSSENHEDLTQDGILNDHEISNCIKPNAIDHNNRYREDTINYGRRRLVFGKGRRYLKLIYPELSNDELAQKYLIHKGFSDDAYDLSILPQPSKRLRLDNSPAYKKIYLTNHNLKKAFVSFFTLPIGRPEKFLCLIFLGFSLGIFFEIFAKNIIFLTVFQSILCLAVILIVIYLFLRVYFKISDLYNINHSLKHIKKNKQNHSFSDWKVIPIMQKYEPSENVIHTLDDENLETFNKLLANEDWYIRNKGKYILIADGELIKISDNELSLLDWLKSNNVYQNCSRLLASVCLDDIILEEPTSFMFEDFDSNS